MRVIDGLACALNDEVSARQKIDQGKPLGFEIEPLIAAAGKR